MKNKEQNAGPIIRLGESGLWYAYGKGWAVCALTEKEAIEKYNKRERFYLKLAGRPIPDYIYPANV